MPVIEGGVVMPGAGQRIITEVIGAAALATGAVLAAVTDTATDQTITTGISFMDRPRRVTATAGGTAADIKAVQVIVAGTDPLGNSISETMPAFTVNTAGSVTGVKVFARVTSITLPAHDGTGATTSISAAGQPAVADADGILAAVQDTATDQTITTGINQPEVPRNITATAAASTTNDVAAISVIIAGTNAEDAAISETLTAFTDNTPATKAGAKAFKTVTSITIPAHDGTSATTSIGFGDVLGLNHRLARKTVKSAYLAETLEGTAPTVAVSATAIESNTVDLDTALNSTQVKVEFIPTSPGN